MGSGKVSKQAMSKFIARVVGIEQKMDTCNFSKWNG